jgi:rusticyanin
VTTMIGVAAVVAGGAVAGLIIETSGDSSAQGRASSGDSYSYYQSMMGTFGGSSMMGGSNGSMMGATGYRWMMGGTSAPGWMSGGALPSYMLGTSTNPGQVMGKLFANAPGSRVSPTQAARLGDETPSGGTVNAARTVVSFVGTTVHVVMLASPSGRPNDSFRVAGLINPTISVKVGSRVSIEVINADADAAQGLVVTASRSHSSAMPMATATPAFSGSALWFMGDPTSAGMHVGTLSFKASSAGTYQYLSPVPGHAEMGMIGTFIVEG